MTRIQQNIIHIFLVILVFLGCIKAFGESVRTESKGVFLSSSIFLEGNAIAESSVVVKKINYGDDLSNNLGRINIVGHQTSRNQSQNMVCEENLKVAIKIAAKNGISNLKYICLPFNEQNDAQLISFAFRGA